jgi:polyisoprenoid-binding protein YceI
MILAAVQTAPSSAAWAAPGTLAPRRYYRIEQDRSRVTIETRTRSLLSQAMRSHVLAARDFRGQVSLVPGAPETIVADFTVRADSLTITDEMSETSRRDVDRAIKKALEASRFPLIAFHASASRATAVRPDDYDVAASGTLDLHGVQRPLTVPAQVSSEGDALHIRGSITLRQTDYGLAPVSTGKEAMNVTDEVVLTFTLVATAAPVTHRH